MQLISLDSKVRFLHRDLFFAHQGCELNLYDLIRLIDNGVDPSTVTVKIGYKDTKKIKEALSELTQDDSYVDICQYGTALVYKKNNGERLVVFIQNDQVFLIVATADQERRRVEVFSSANLSS